MRNREMMTISLSPDTKERLKAYASERHTSVSQAITDWIWGQPLKSDTQATGAAPAGGKDND